MIDQYDIVELIVDLNPIILKGMRATVLEKYGSNDFEIEVVDLDGRNIQFENSITFTVTGNQIKKIEDATIHLKYEPMNPRIETAKERKLVGERLTMSFSNYKVAELWRNLGPKRKEITNNLNNDLISITVYKPGHFAEFKPTNEFDKWAAIEVLDFNKVPIGLETFVLSGGLYSVFDYKGLDTDNSIFKYIYGTWIPNSEYILDDRPHFEVLGEKYRHNDLSSEEEIWIPIKKK